MKTLYNAIANLPLKDMDGSLLSAAIMFEAAKAGVKGLDDLREAIDIASYLHRNDTRQTRGNLPKDTYITHPLRNTLRLIRYGVTDTDVLIASVLHDTVEDHAEDIVADLCGASVDGLDAEQVRSQALAFISGRFGAEVARIVHAVSNPIAPVGVRFSKDEKRARYADHILAVVPNDFSVFLVKFADFYDNAGSLHHTDSPSNRSMTEHLVTKYLLVAPIFQDAIMGYSYRSEMVLPDEGRLKLGGHFTAVKNRLENFF